MKPKTPDEPAQQAAFSLRADTSGCPVERLPELIQKRAYEIYEAHGRQPDRQVEDWLQAEAEVKWHFGI